MWIVWVKKILETQILFCLSEQCIIFWPNLAQVPQTLSQSSLLFTSNVRNNAEPCYSSADVTGRAAAVTGTGFVCRRSCESNGQKESASQGMDNLKHSILMKRMNEPFF